MNAPSRSPRRSPASRRTRRGTGGGPNKISPLAAALGEPGECIVPRGTATMQLLLMRHGHAVDDAPGLRDRGPLALPSRARDHPRGRPLGRQARRPPRSSRRRSCAPCRPPRSSPPRSSSTSPSPPTRGLQRRPPLAPPQARRARLPRPPHGRRPTSPVLSELLTDLLGSVPWNGLRNPPSPPSPGPATATPASTGPSTPPTSPAHTPSDPQFVLSVKGRSDAPETMTFFSLAPTPRLVAP